MKREEIIQRGKKKFPPVVIEEISDDGTITRTDVNATIRNVYIQGLVDNNCLLPSNLDEAAEKYSENILANNEDLQDAIEDAFKAGVEWTAGQGISVEGDTDSGIPDEYYIRLEDYLNSLPKGTKLVFQIREKQ